MFHEIPRELIDRLDPRAAAAAEHADLANMQPAVLRLLGRESISTRFELATALAQAPNGNSIMAASMLLENHPGGR